MAGYPYLIVDVFTSEALAGNQLAVFTKGQTIPQERLQPLALEMGFSETVFVLPPLEQETARIRIFTPTSEVPFEITDRTATGAFGRMRQPIPTGGTLPDPQALFAALRVTGSELPVEIYDNGIPHVYVALRDLTSVAAVAPDYGALADLARTSGMPILGINCFAGAGRRWTTRMFAPADGVPEDAATGSAAGPLACHLARHDRIAFGDEIVICQGAEIGRPSTLYATAHGSRDAITRVEVAGMAIVVASGAFHLP